MWKAMGRSLCCVRAFLRVAETHLSLFNRSSVEYSLPRFLSSLISPWRDRRRSWYLTACS